MLWHELRVSLHFEVFPSTRVKFCQCMSNIKVAYRDGCSALVSIRWLP